MFEKLMKAAERAASGVSRREYFGELGRGARRLADPLGIRFIVNDDYGDREWGNGYYHNHGR